MSEEEILAEVERHRGGNAELRDALMENEIPLEEERPVEVHFWALAQREAAFLARDLYQRGYLVTEISRAEGEDLEERWNVEAGANIAPERALGEAFTEDLVRLAGSYDAVYDGWGTTVGGEGGEDGRVTPR